MTQKELAEKLQVSFQMVSKWENGVNMPDITHIPKLAEIFGVSTDVILGVQPIQQKDNPGITWLEAIVKTGLHAKHGFIRLSDILFMTCPMDITDRCCMVQEYQFIQRKMILIR